MVETSRDPGLLGLQLIELYGPGVKRLEKLVPILAELCSSTSLLALLIGYLGLCGLHLVPDDSLEAATLIRRQCETHVQPLDGNLNVIDRKNRLGATTVALSTKAEEVGVNGAVSVLGVHDTQPRATTGAVNRAFQVVRMTTVFFRGHAVRIKHRLHA